MFRGLLVMLVAAMVLLVVTAVPAEVINSNMKGRIGFGVGQAVLVSVVGELDFFTSPQIIYGLTPNLYLLGGFRITQYRYGSVFSISMESCYNFTPKNQTGMYAGATVGWISSDGASTFYLGPVGGIQHFLTQNIAVDGQLRLVFYSGETIGTSFEPRLRINFYLR